jgi:hypothetical protein
MPPGWAMGHQHTDTVADMWGSFWDWFGTQAPEIQAAWIGVAGALVGGVIGAFVGGFMSSRSAARVTREQWDRELHDRRFEKLENGVEAVMDGLAAAHNARGDDVETVVVPLAVANLSRSVTMRARTLSPHLYAQLNPLGRDAEVRNYDVLATSESVFSMVSVLNHWFEDPTAYERDKPDLAASERHLFLSNHPEWTTQPESEPGRG